MFWLLALFLAASAIFLLRWAARREAEAREAEAEARRAAEEASRRALIEEERRLEAAARAAAKAAHAAAAPPPPPPAAFQVPGDSGEDRPMTGAELRDRQGGVLLLIDACWDCLVVNNVRGSYRGPQPPSGFTFVPPGRHRVVLAGGDGRPAVLDLVLYPGEVFTRRYDAGAGAWEPIPPELDLELQERTIGEDAPLACTLIPYPPTIGAKLGYRPADSAGLVEQTVAGFVALAERARAGDATAELLAGAAALGERIVGRALSGEEVDRLVATVVRAVVGPALRGDLRSGGRIVTLGLGVLPHDPHLLELQASILSDGGLQDRALEQIDAALRRDQVLDGEKRGRALATKAEILHLLGRTRDAQILLAEILEEDPTHVEALRVRARIGGPRARA